MDTKAAFEKFREWWFADDQAELRLNFAEGCGFKIWLASRLVIEIELPEKFFIDDDFDRGHNLGIDDCAEAITSHGIRIKGKTE